MNPAQDPRFNPPAETERIPFLLSRQLDGDLTLEESLELAVLQQTEAHRSCLAAMIDVRGQLKALQVKRVSASFATSVRDAIHQSSTTVSATSTPDSRRGRIMRGIVAVSVTVCAAALMMFLRSQDVDRSDGNGQIVHADGQHAAERTTIPSPATMAATMAATSPATSPATMAAADEVAEPGAFVPEAEPRPNAVAVQNAIAQEDDMRPFIENDKWRIVVVTINSKDSKEVMRIVESVAAKNGMDIQPVVGNEDHDPRFGVLFTSTGDHDNAFIDSVISETKAQSANWNPQLVANSTSDRFIHLIQESMKSPTLSEMHFGRVYVALLKSAKTSAAASQPLLAQNEALDGASRTPPVDQKTTRPPNEVATVPSARNTPVLLVFEFTDTAPDHI